jgi:hypothetical protein
MNTTEVAIILGRNTVLVLIYPFISRSAGSPDMRSEFR